MSAFKNITNLLEQWYDKKSILAYNNILCINQQFFDYFSSGKVEKHFSDILNEIHDIHSYTREYGVTLGEKISVAIISHFLQKNLIDINICDVDPLIYIEESKELDLGKTITQINIAYFRKISDYVITQGFACWDHKIKGSNLGREGSDLTAILWAYVLHCECSLYKDVSALYTGDPKKYPNAQIVPNLTFTEYKKGYLGTGFIHDRVIDFCLKHKEMRLEIRSLDDQVGTSIKNY